MQARGVGELQPKDAVREIEATFYRDKVLPSRPETSGIFGGTVWSLFLSSRRKLRCARPKYARTVQPCRLDRSAAMWIGDRAGWCEGRWSVVPPRSAEHSLVELSFSKLR